MIQNLFIRCIIYKQNTPVNQQIRFNTPVNQRIRFSVIIVNKLSLGVRKLRQKHTNRDLESTPGPERKGRKNLYK